MKRLGCNQTSREVQAAEEERSHKQSRNISRLQDIEGKIKKKKKKRNISIQDGPQPR